MTTPLSEMALPDEVANAARDAFEELDGPLLYGYKAAIRAALQAMLDNGMARKGNVIVNKHLWSAISGELPGGDGPCIIICLDADERKRDAIRALAPSGEGEK